MTLLFCSLEISQSANKLHNTKSRSSGIWHLVVI